jgi:ribosomal protein S18 acetylase RimI-like enzyme
MISSLATPVPGASDHPLDHPIWNALITRQRALAEGDSLALRYPSEIAPFAAMADASLQSFAALHALMKRSDQVVLFTLDPVNAPAEFNVLLAKTGEQMIGTPLESVGSSTEIVRLDVDDVVDMMELASLTKPGPFTARAHELGTFLGIRTNGRLVAMAGERMKPGNYTEMTAICVHPDYRGRGHAQALLGAVAGQISARREIPFLHVFSDNHSAISLYRRQGMESRCQIHVTVLERAV